MKERGGDFSKLKMQVYSPFFMEFTSGVWRRMEVAETGGTPWTHHSNETRLIPLPLHSDADSNVVTTNLTTTEPLFTDVHTTEVKAELLTANYYFLLLTNVWRSNF